MATSVNTMVAKIGSDISGLRSGLRLARTDINRTNRVMQMAKTDADRFRDAATSLHKSLRAGQISKQQYAAGLQEISKRYLVMPEQARRQAAETKRLADEQKRAAETARKNAEQQRESARREAEARRIAAVAAQRQAEANRRLQQGVQSLAREEQQREALLKRQGQMLRGIRQDTDQAAAANQKMVGTIGAIAGAYLSFQGAKSALKIASDMQQASIAFEVMAGSASKGQMVLSDLRQFAASTPITFDGAQRSAQTLMAFGIEAEKVVPTLRMLGDVSGGNADRFQMLSLAFAQMSSAGKLMGQDLLQMVNAGFNPLQEISRQTGQSLTDLRKQMEQGAISSQMVVRAFQSATGEGGRFFGMMDRMSGTALGAYSQLTSALQELVAELGSFVLPALAQTAKATEYLVRQVSALIVPTNQSAARWGALLGGFTTALVVIPKVISIIRSIIVAIKAMTTAQVTMLAFAGPKGWATIAASAAVAAIAVIGVNQAFASQTAELEKATEGTKEFAAANKQAASAIALTQGQLDNRRKVEEFSKSLEKMRFELAALRMGEGGDIWLAKVQALANGATEAQTQELEILLKKRKAIEAAQKAEEDRLNIIKQQQQAVRELFNQGQSLTEKHNPVAAVAKQLGEIQMLLQIGAINEATFYRERAAILRANTRDIGQSQSPKAIEVGSQEAINFVTDRMNQRQDESLRLQQEQKTLQEAQLAANLETNRRLAEIGIFKRAR